jgi:hypothetical protein
MAGGSLLCLVVLIPALNIGLGSEQARFIVLILALAAISAACIQLALPKKADENSYDDVIVVPARPKIEDVQDIETQVDLFKGLQAAFARRVRVRRGIGDAEWAALDAGRLEKIVGDPELAMLVAGKMELAGNGPDDFNVIFDRLLRKVEDWR